MKIAVVLLSALCSASLFAQAPQGGRAGAPPPPPATETVATAIPGVVAAGTKVAIVKDGLRSSEGPILMPDGTTLFTEPGASRVHKIDKSGAMSVFIENTERANGLALDSKGRLIATTADSIVVLHPAKEVLAKMPSRPNDLVIDKKDGIYFTLPSDKPSAVYYIAKGGQAVKVGEAPGAHGIQLSPDEKTLYSADSGGEYLIAFDVQPDGKLTNKRNFGKYQGLPTPESHADGIAVDGQGRVYVGIATGVQVFSPKGDALGVIPTSQRPQNLAFAGPDKKTLYLTGGSAMFSVKMLAEGYKGRAK
jgi:gluconolactonase